jgi:hypothetical protein
MGILPVGKLARPIISGLKTYIPSVIGGKYGFLAWLRFSACQKNTSSLESRSYQFEWLMRS